MRVRTAGHLMHKPIIILGVTIGGAIGWWIGAFVGTMTAFMLSMVGTALGLYLARRWIAANLP